MGIASYAVPRFEIPALGSEVFSSWSWTRHLARTADPEARIYQTLLGLAPVLGSLLVGLTALFRKGSPVLLRWLLLGFLLGWAFTLSTMGSIAATSPAGAEEAGAWAILQFAVPLGLVAVVLARVIGGADEGLTARIVRACLAGLLLLQSLLALSNPSVQAHAGAALPIAAGLLLLAGSVFPSPRRAPIPESAAPAGNAP